VTVLTSAAGSLPTASGGHALGAGFIAFVVVLVLAVSCFFLFRSMTRHLRKVPRSFDPPPPTAEADKN
jgi:cell division protein FtsX